MAKTDRYNAHVLGLVINVKGRDVIRSLSLHQRSVKADSCEELVTQPVLPSEIIVNDSVEVTFWLPLCSVCVRCATACVACTRTRVTRLIHTWPSAFVVAFVGSIVHIPGGIGVCAVFTPPNDHRSRD